MGKELPEKAILERAFGCQGNNLSLPVQDVDAAVPIHGWELSRSSPELGGARR